MMKYGDKNVPCYGCERRHVESGYNCHSDCSAYKEYKEKCAGEAAAVREKKGYEAEYTDTRIRGLAKTKRKKIRQNVWRG